jgi:tetratricopeptide (TPR) repeat protein
MSCIARLIAAALLVACLPAIASAKWIRLRTEHFVFIGDASEGDIRRVAQKLDEFRDALTRALGGGATKSPVPTVVVVFRSDSSFTPYKPHFQGHPIELAGVFQDGDDASYIAINAEAIDVALRTIFHEYTHFLVGNTAGIVPVWMNEGLAELYATFEERGGRSAMLGVPNPLHLELLRGTSLMPLRELMAVDHASAVYNEGNRRGVFYAQSWALMHYLTLGNQARTPQLHTYLAALRHGEPPDEAFQKAFGDVAQLERELNTYVRRFIFQALRIDFGEKAGGAASGRGLAIDDAEASAYLGDLLARLHRSDDARAHFRKLIEAHTQSARAVYGLGVLELNAGYLGEALPLLERAVALDGNEAAYQSALGRALLARYDEAGTEATAAATLQRARTVLARAAELDPQAVNTLVMLGSAELLTGTDVAYASSLFERAVRMAPAREHYRLLLGQSLIAQNELAKARTHLGPLLAAGSRPEIRDAARRLMGTIAVRSAPSAERSTAGGGERAAIPVDPARRPQRESAPGSTSRPVLRKTEAGETRVLGLFTAVECRPDGILFQITIENRSLRLAAAKFDEVDFITYRSEAPGSVKCGAVQPPSHVLATYRPRDAGTSGIDGQLVAIELLPDGYTPE